jgi:hypothetical protein
MSYNGTQNPGAEFSYTEYLKKEEEAASKLLTIQSKNAQTLNKLRLDLLGKLNDEALKEGKAVEEYLAHYGLQQRLEALSTELKARQQGQSEHLDELFEAHKQASNTLIAAEQKLAEIRRQRMASEEKRQSEASKKALAAAELDAKRSIARGCELLKVAEENIVALRMGTEDDIAARRLELLARTRGAESATDMGLPDPTVIETNINTLSAASADAYTKMLAYFDRQRDEIKANAELAEYEQQARLAAIQVDEFAAKEQLKNAELTLLQSLADERAILAQAELDTRLADLAVIYEQELSQEQTLAKRRLENLRAYHQSSANKRKSANPVGKELKQDNKKIEPIVDYLVVLDQFEKTITKKADELAEANQKAAEQKAAQQMQGLWNMGHSVDDIKKYANLAPGTDTAEAAKENINYEARAKELAAALQAEQLLQADEVAQRIFEAQLEGIELDRQAVEAKVAEERQAVTDEIARRQFALDVELQREQSSADQILADKEKSAKAQAKLDKKKQQEESKFGKSFIGKVLGTANSITSFGDVKAKMAAGELSPEDAQASAQAELDSALNAVGGWISQLASTGKVAVAKQAAVDTRLQGSATNDTKLGSYWRRIDADITKAVGISPFILQETVASSVERLVGEGISFNIEQRAFLDALKDKIATTFNATDGALLKLVRIQQADTTAARLGMESALTSFLNSMYETSEFMQSTAASIRENLYEATALMTAKEATDYEFQVQKWLGSLYSVGFSASEKVADSLGKLTAGDISGITEGGIGNLLVMAANEASLPIAEILEKGLNASETDRLMESMVRYLARIYEETKESRVLAQQYGNVFGVTAADLKAVANLVEADMKAIANRDVTYDNMLNQLHSMANSMLLRTSTGEMFENIKQNFAYSMATTLANNPVLSGLNNMANMLNDLVGGIEIPFINIYGFGFDLNATIADLMNVAALSGTVLGGVGKMISSLASGGGFSGSGMLNSLGISKGTLLEQQRGGGGANLTTLGGATTSDSGMVAGNESGDDIKNKTVQDASEEPEKQVAEAKEEQEDKEEARAQMTNENILLIYNLLNEVTQGSKKWYVHLDVGNMPTSWSPGTWN